MCEVSSRTRTRHDIKTTMRCVNHVQIFLHVRSAFRRVFFRRAIGSGLLVDAGVARHDVLSRKFASELEMDEVLGREVRGSAIYPNTSIVRKSNNHLLRVSL
jgi:hypothetical protein